MKNWFSDPKTEVFRQDRAVLRFPWPFLCKKMTKNYFYHGYQHPIWPKKDKKRVYFGPFRPKIDPKMVSYKITFTKNWFFITTFHLFTQIRIILDHQVWDHFSNKRNLNKRIWVFWAPVLEKKSNRVPKYIAFPYGFNKWFLITICYLWMLYFINSRTKLCQTPLDSPKILPLINKIL